MPVKDDRDGPGTPLLPVTVEGVSVDPLSGMPAVLLREEEGRRRAAIGIGLAEAAVVTAALEEIQLERPLPHDLMKSMLGIAGLELVHVEVLACAGHVHPAVLVLRDRERALHRLPARPADALALALRAGARVLLAAAVLERAGCGEPAEREPRRASLPPRRPSGPWPRLPSSPMRRPRWRA